MTGIFLRVGKRCVRGFLGECARAATQKGQIRSACDKEECGIGLSRYNEEGQKDARKRAKQLGAC